MTFRTTKAAAKAAILENRGLFWRQLVPLILTAIGILLFRDRIFALDFSQIEATIRQVSAIQWGFAIAATGASYWAVGRYDGLVHGLLGTGVASNTSMKSGITSIAIAQFAGFGILTGALVRWRLLSGFDLMQSLRVSLFVTVTFLAGWACLTAASVLILHPAFESSQIWATMVLAALAVLIVLSVTGLKMDERFRRCKRSAQSSCWSQLIYFSPALASMYYYQSKIVSPRSFSLQSICWHLAPGLLAARRRDWPV